MALGLYCSPPMRAAIQHVFKSTFPGDHPARSQRGSEVQSYRRADVSYAVKRKARSSPSRRRPGH
eukprot:3682313-Pyramimonas_sp.AAC.1